MTAKELYAAYLTLADSASQAHLKPARFAQLYWLCQIEWLKDAARQPVTELSRASLRPFRKTAVSGGRTIALGAIKPAVLVVRGVRADFDADRVGIPVTPADDDEIGVRQLDPFRKATNDAPLYTEEEGVQVVIHADSDPLNVRLSYLTFPEPLNLVADSQPPESVDSQWAILRRVVAEKDLIDEKYNRYQLLAGRVIPQAEQPT